MNRPLVTVVMAVKNAERFLAEALDSVMAQTYAPHEIVVVDGRSTDGTEVLARSYPTIRFITQTGDGFAGAWNDGIAIAAGELIAFLDGDDRWTPHKLAVQVASLAENPDAQGAIGLVKFFTAPGQPTPSGFKPELLVGEYVAHMPGALLARRTLFDEVGRFGTEWKIASDIDWFAKVKDRGCHIAIVPEVVIYKRVHDSNLSYVTAKTSLMNEEILRLLHQSIHRQRDPAGRRP